MCFYLAAAALVRISSQNISFVSGGRVEVCHRRSPVRYADILWSLTMALSTNSGVISGLNSAEPLSSRNCSEAVDENANEAPAAAADEDEEDAKDKGRKGGGGAGGLGEAGWTPTTPTTPKGPLVGCGDTSLNTSALTSPDEQRAPEPVLDVDMDRLRRSVPSLLSSFKGEQRVPGTLFLGNLIRGSLDLQYILQND